MSASQLKELGDFISHTTTFLDDIENDLLSLEKNPVNQEKINSVFRAFHTIKGEANLLGIVNLGGLAHVAENFLEKARSGILTIDAETVSGLLETTDVINNIIQVLAKDTAQGLAYDVVEAKKALEGLLEKKSSKPKEEKPSPAPVASDKGAGSGPQEEKFVPKIPTLDLSDGPQLVLEFVTEGFEHLNNAENSILVLEKSPSDQEAVNNIFRAFHTIKGVAGFMSLDDIRTFAHEAETMLDMVRNGKLSFVGRVVEQTLMSIDVLRQLLTLLNEQANNGGKLNSPYLNIEGNLNLIKEIISGKAKEPIGEILISQGAITADELSSALAAQNTQTEKQKVGEILLDTHAASAKQVQSALDAQKAGAPVENAIKIQLEKLDLLIDSVGELVISETQIVQSPTVFSIEDQKFRKNLAELDRITRGLQLLVMGMRLVPIRPIFQKMTRLVRDLSKKLNKEIEIDLSGEDSEIDKNMVELISDPLMHMVRNSVDHGIESREERIKAGKPSMGRVGLSAYHKGGSVVIEIRDDGGGLRKDKILKKAIEKGLVREGENLSEYSIFNLIFEPGFSTAEVTTDVSGRGVGMDVVKRNIEKMRGRIDIQSQEGNGSVFSVYLPITLAIIEGIVVQVGAESYILPINSVVEFVHAQTKDLSLLYDKGEMYRFFDKIYPLIRLSTIFGIAGARERFEDQTVCVIESEHGRACVLVDALLGQQQVVIKSLGDSLKKLKGVSGATILADGRVGVILDTNGLVDLAQNRGAA